MELSKIQSQMWQIDGVSINIINYAFDVKLKGTRVKHVLQVDSAAKMDVRTYITGYCILMDPLDQLE